MHDYLYNICFSNSYFDTDDVQTDKEVGDEEEEVGIQSEEDNKTWDESDEKENIRRENKIKQSQEKNINIIEKCLKTIF